MPETRSILRRFKFHVPWALLAVLLLFAYNAACTPGFFHFEFRDGKLFGSILDVAKRASPVALTALGMTLVIATGGVDLSVGAVMAIAGAVMAQLLAQNHSVGVALGFALSAGILAGALNGVVVSLLGVQPIVATLILMVAGRGIAQLITGGYPIEIAASSARFLGSGFLLALPVAILICAAAYAISHLLLRITALGFFIEAAGDNPVASRISGVPVAGVRFFVYLFCGLCSAVAGVLAAADIHMADPNNSGKYVELDAILAVVLGGTALTGGRFTLFGTLVGAFLMQALTTTIQMRGTPNEVALIIKSLVVIGVCLLYSESLRAAFSRRRVAVKP